MGVRLIPLLCRCSWRKCLLRWAVDQWMQHLATLRFHHASRRYCCLCWDYASARFLKLVLVLFVVEVFASKKPRPVAIFVTSSEARGCRRGGEGIGSAIPIAEQCSTAFKLWNSLNIFIWNSQDFFNRSHHIIETKWNSQIYTKKSSQPSLKLQLNANKNPKSFFELVQ